MLFYLKEEHVLGVAIQTNGLPLKVKRFTDESSEILFLLSSL